MSESSSPDKMKREIEKDREVNSDSLERRKSRLLETIDRANKESSERIRILGEEATQIANKVSDEANAVINYHRSVSRKITETVNNTETKVRETILSIASSLDYFFWIVAGLLVASGLVFGVTLSTISTIYLIIFSPVWVAASFAILFVLRSRVGVLRLRSSDLGQLKNMQEEMVEIVASLPQPQPDIEAFEKSVKALGNVVSDLAIATSDLVRTDLKLVKLKLRDEFVRNFLLALDRYGFTYDSQIEQNFKSTLTSEGDQNSWLEYVLNEGKVNFPNIAHSVLRLVYFESIRDYRETAKQWDVVKRTLPLKLQLASIIVKNNLLSTPNVGENFVPVLSDLLESFENFSLGDVKVAVAGFVERLTAFKIDSINHLALFGLNIVEGVVELMSFMPRSSSIDKWRNEVLTYIANDQLHVDVNFVELLVRDAIGDAGKIKYWHSIVKSNTLTELAMILAKKRIAKVHSEFTQEIYVRHLVFAMENSLDDFSLSQIENNIRSMEDTILIVEKNLKRTAQLYRLDLNDFSYVNTFVPKDTRTVESELIAISSHRINLNTKIFELLYYTAVGSDRASKCFTDIVGEAADNKLLADFLVSNGFVPKDASTQIIIPLLKSRKSFDLVNFTFDYSQYEKLFKTTQNLWAFMRKKRVCDRITPLGFQDILKLCPPDSKDEFSDKLVTIAHALLTNKIGEHELTKEQIEQIGLVTAMLFLFSLQDLSYKRLCQRIAIDLLASRILYRYIRVADEAALILSDPKLDAAFSAAIDLQSDDPNFDYFKATLGNGILYARASWLIGARLHDITEEVKRLRKCGFDSRVLDGIVEAMRHILYDSLSVGVLRDLVISQIIVPYSIMIPPNHPANMLIDSGNFLEKAQSGSALKNGEDIVRLSRPARIGVVPLGMPFELFGKKFEEIFSSAVKLYNAKHQSNALADPRVLYITRIFSFDGNLKEIGNSGENQRSLEMLRILMRSSLSGIECLELLALLQPVSQSSIAVRRALESIIDEPNRRVIYTNLDKNKDIEVVFENHGESLLKSYDTTQISLLCKVIADQIEKSGEERAQKKFYEIFKKCMPANQLISKYKEEVLMRTLFRRLSNLGVVFS